MGTAKTEEKKYRLVLDTNIYISMYGFPGGTLEPIMQHLQRRTFTVIVSPFIMNEFGRVARTRIDMKEHSIQSALRKIARIAEIIQPETVPSVVPNDPDDNNIIACAVAGKADLIISGDKHLRSLKQYQSITIVHPTDFVRTLEGL